MNEAFEPVIGLEVHCELKTKTKIFCSCKNTFGAPQNTCCCPVCMGLPGAMPTLNAEAVSLAVKAGIALECGISSACRMDRKNYFYPDLPKGYQISQLKYPVCKNGCVEIGDKKIGITRIHIEEDAGKLIHEGETTLADFNRSGVPLIASAHAEGAEGALKRRGLRELCEEGVFGCIVGLSRRGGEFSFDFHEI